MKNIFFTIFIAIHSISFAQVVDFDSGEFPPTEPYVITTPEYMGDFVSVQAAKWYRSDDTIIREGYLDTDFEVGYGGEGHCAILNWSAYSGDSTKVDMIVNRIDLSSYSSPALFFQLKNPREGIELEIAASVLEREYEILSSLTSVYDDWTLIYVDLSSFQGLSDVNIRFRGRVSSGSSSLGVDNIEIRNQTPMVLRSTKVSKINCGLKQGYPDQPILRMEIETDGSLNPMKLTKLLFSTEGTSNDCDDVALKKIYYTGSDSSFHANNLIDSYDLEGLHRVETNASLASGKNYFWLAYDIQDSATISNSVNAVCEEIEINGEVIKPSVKPTESVRIDNSGIFKVENLKDSGPGSLRAAILAAASYDCGNAVVDATGVSGTILWKSHLSFFEDHDLTILGSGPNKLTIRGEKDRFIYHNSNGSLTIQGIKFSNFNPSEYNRSTIYKPSDKGNLHIKNCIADSNAVRFIYMPGVSGNLIIENSTFSNNSSNQETIVYAVDMKGSIKLLNSTFYQNQGGLFAGIMFAVDIKEGLYIENCTFMNNSSTQGSTGTILSGSSTNEVINTTFENNSPTDFAGKLNMNYSHMSNTSSAQIFGSNNILNVSAQLSPIADNGGSTPTCAITADSPLIDSGVSNHPYDQRGLARNNTRDIGAFEYQGKKDVIAPVPNQNVLPTIVENCSLSSLEYPKATDDNAKNISINHNVCLPIVNIDTTVVTWTYEDDYGNRSTQTQKVIILDNEAPVADVSVLDDIRNVCSVTSLNAPTAFDQCVGAIVGIHDASFPIKKQGTTVVTWTYDDGNGNISKQSQNVIIEDNNAPVPDQAQLIEIRDCVEATPDTPTATDSCIGTIIGTSDTTFPITKPGKTVVTWTYDDGNGNITKQSQNIIIEDDNDPVLDQTQLIEIKQCGEVTPDTPTATDSCTGTIIGTSDTTFPITKPGKTVVTWTYDDGNGNSVHQKQNIIIDTLDTTITFNDINAISNESGALYQWLDCRNDYAEIPNETQQNFTPKMSGEYAVHINKNGCLDTSVCVVFISVGIVEENINNKVIVFPNPNNGFVTIDLGKTLESITIDIHDITGQKIQSSRHTTSRFISLDLEVPPGTYLLTVKSKRDRWVERLTIY